MAKINNIPGLDVKSMMDETPEPAKDSLKDRGDRAAEYAAGKPSPYEAELRHKLRLKKRFNFGELPSFIVDFFDVEAERLGMNRRELLYHFIRESGYDVPPYEKLDGRKL